jgi:hypothetical protein
LQCEHLAQPGDFGDTHPQTSFAQGEQQRFEAQRRDHGGRGGQRGKTTPLITLIQETIPKVAGYLTYGAVLDGAPAQGMIGTAVIEFFGEPSISLSL